MPELLLQDDCVAVNENILADVAIERRDGVILKPAIVALGLSRGSAIRRGLLLGSETSKRLSATYSFEHPFPEALSRKSA
jgi:hypothetical protein